MPAIGLVVVVTDAAGVSGSRTITTIAGSGARGFSGDGGPATSARMSYPWGVAVDGKGNVYIADLFNSRIRKVSPGGKITTIAGNGGNGFSGDGGPATSARLYHPFAVAADQQGNVYLIASAWGETHPVVRKVSPSGTITRFAGTGKPGFSGDGGPATAANLRDPFGVAVDSRGNVYISDWSRVRKVSPGGTITTIAGTGKAGFSGDGGPATSAQISRVVGIAVDRKGNVYIADGGNSRIRKVSAGGTITTIAGTGKAGSSGDGGPATSARLVNPLWVAADTQGNVYFGTHQVGNSVRKVSAGGTISTFAGTGAAGFSGDGGPATLAKLYGPKGVAVDGQGNVYIADSENFRVRKVRSG